MALHKDGGPAKAIAWYEEHIARPIDKTQNPTAQLPGFDQLDPRQQQALIEKTWPAEIKDARDQIEILRRLLDQTGKELR